MEATSTLDDVRTRHSVDGVAYEPSRLSGAILGGRYQVLGFLSEGATARVYVARDLEEQFGNVALKVLTPDAREREEFRALIVQEARAAMRIAHPNVVRVLDVNDGEVGPSFVVMEALSGEALGDLLRREGALGRERALELGGQIAHGLLATHEVGVVHRDVKPDNVFVTAGPDGSERIKILDFGMARVDGASNGDPHTVLGTAAYMSPEQILAEQVDARSDVYSFGVVLFRMLTGHLPFDAQASGDLLRHQLFSAVPPLDWLLEEPDPGLEAVVVNATRKEPRNRYPDMAELLTDLGAARRSEPVRLRPLAHEPDAYEPRTDQGARAANLLARQFGAYARPVELRSRTRLRSD